MDLQEMLDRAGTGTLHVEEGWGQGRATYGGLVAGLALAALAVGKLLFFDLSFLSGIPRVLSFIVAGLLLLGMGVGYAQALERTRREQPAVDNPPAPSPIPPTV